MNSNRMYVMGRDEGEAVSMLGERLALKAGSKHTGGAFSLLEDRVAPGGGPPPHIHHDEDEAFYILDGQLKVQCGEESFTAESGAFVFLPRGVPHTFSVLGDDVARFLVICSPAGIEGLFQELGEPATSLEPEPLSGPPDIERLIRIANKYNVTLLPPA